MRSISSRASAALVPAPPRFEVEFQGFGHLAREEADAQGDCVDLLGGLTQGDFPRVLNDSHLLHCLVSLGRARGLFEGLGPRHEG